MGGGEDEGRYSMVLGVTIEKRLKIQNYIDRFWLRCPDIFTKLP
jgi:hypothetical protein